SPTVSCLGCVGVLSARRNASPRQLLPGYRSHRLSSSPSDTAPPPQTMLTALGAALIGLQKRMFHEKFSMHTERGAALSAAADLDEELTVTIKKHMIDSSLKAMMFKEGRPLGNFGTKIQVAYLLGIISKLIFEELEVVKEIRNKLA